MQIIRNYLDLKTTLSPLDDYVCCSFTKGPNLFHETHEYLYQQTLPYVTEGKKLIGIVWDNLYDLEIFLSREASPTIIDEQNIISWFENKNFDYLFLPDSDFITKIITSPIFSNLMNEIDQIWVNENYNSLIGEWLNEEITKYIKFVLLRQYILYTNKTGNKFINRTCQVLTPDGTWGYIYRHFMHKYCGGANHPIIPLLREPNGLIFDFRLKLLPKEITDTFELIVPLFDAVKIDKDIVKLTNGINKILTFDGMTKFQRLFLMYVDHFNNEITMNKSIFRVVIRYNTLRDNGRYDEYRVWDYED